MSLMSARSDASASWSVDETLSVVDAAQLLPDLVDHHVDGRARIGGVGVGRHVGVLAGGVAVHVEARAGLGDRDLEARHLGELVRELLAVPLDLGLHVIVELEVLRVDDHGGASGHPRPRARL